MIKSSLCYIKKDGKYLLLHRVKKEHDINKGKWIGVGGKFEPGESAEECVVREVYEETGLTLTEFTHVGVIKFYSDQNQDQDMYLFKGTDFTGTLTDNCPEGELAWVPEDEVLSLPTWEGDHLFLEPLMQGKTNLNMTVKYEHDVLTEFIDATEPVNIDKSSVISALHGFSTRLGGVSDGMYKSLNLGMKRGDDDYRVIENYRRFFEAVGIKTREFVCGNQVHKSYVHIASREDARPALGPGEVIEADGYVTREKDLPLVIFTADCVPLLLEDSVKGVIGAIHCGWRSTVADIENEAIKKMVSLGANPSDIHAAIGPAIDMCSFEVGEDVVEAVENLLKENSCSFYNKKENGKYMLNLRGVVKERLIELGVKEENIEIVGGCTMCNHDRYFSHRYTNGARGSLASVISL